MKSTEIRRLRKTIRSFDRLTNRQIKRCCRSVTVAQCHVLLELDARERVTTSRLARELHLDKSTVSLTIDGLVESRLVTRVPDRDDRRVTQLKLTRKGQAMCDELNKVNDEYIGKILERIPRERRQAVIDDFAIFVEAILQHEEADE